MSKKKEFKSKFGQVLRIRNVYIRCFLAEFLGTFILMCFLLSSIIQYKFFSSNNVLLINLSDGLGLTMCIIITGKVSGGHANPAVSLAAYLTNGISFIKLIIYIIAQHIGAFVASMLIYSVYLREFIKYENGWFSIDSSTMFGSVPNNTLSSCSLDTIPLFWDQFLATCLYIICIISIADQKNTPPEIPHVFKAILCGLALFVTDCAFGLNCGYAINPARDFAPRIFTLIFGWGGKVFSDLYFWIPMVAPMLGSAFAVLVYKLFISHHFYRIDDLNNQISSDVSMFI